MTAFFQNNLRRKWSGQGVRREKSEEENRHKHHCKERSRSSYNNLSFTFSDNKEVKYTCQWIHGSKSYYLEVGVVEPTDSMGGAV
jgi:hypothetical protein